jgi:hypothetical protein
MPDNPAPAAPEAAPAPPAPKAAPAPAPQPSAALVAARAAIASLAADVVAAVSAHLGPLPTPRVNAIMAAVDTEVRRAVAKANEALK